MNKSDDFINTASPDTLELLNNTALQEGFQNYKIKGTNMAIKGEGYVGTIASIRIEDADNGSANKPLNLILKTASKTDALRTQACVEMIYHREIYMYHTVFPAFRSFEVTKGLPPSTFTAKFYKGEEAYKKEALVLEDLNKSGFKLYDRKIPMDDDHVSLVMITYGRLHALSFALRDQDPDAFRRIVGTLDDVWMKAVKQGNFNSGTGELYKRAGKSLNPDLHNKAIKTYSTFTEKIPEYFRSLALAVDEYSVALHADGWTNNIFFKYKDDHGVSKPVDIRLIDFQVSRLGPPILDLAYFFYSCSSKEIINNLDHYLKLYYDSFSSYLTKLGSDQDKMYPYSVFQDQWKKYAWFGLMMSVVVIHRMLTEKEEAVDVEDLIESNKSVGGAFNYEISKTDEFCERTRHNILHFVENNYYYIGISG